MIRTEKQLNVTQSRIKEFSEALLEIESQEMDALLKSLHIGQLKAQIEIFENEVFEYQQLKNKLTPIIQVSLYDLPLALVKARIYRGYTHADLADKMNLKEQQIQRYEACNYSTASLQRLLTFAQVLGLQVDTISIHLNTTVITVSGYDSDELKNAQSQLMKRKTLVAI